ncbi:uncharacterized protein LOC101737440 [Bombyx mori]|uniref:uncharacterized protein LOC101737440 n=1 Tax=Bombyx mori TaxID=7091 RepID=UPI002ED4C6D5
MHGGILFILVVTATTVAGLELTIDDLLQQQSPELITDSTSSPRPDDGAISTPSGNMGSTDDVVTTTEVETTIKPSVTDENVSITTLRIETEAPTTGLTDRTESEAPSMEQNNLIETTHGLVRGFEWHTTGDIISYIDIPYAKYTKYFEEPKSSNAWETTHEVREHKSRCPQLQGESVVGSQDCLTLSIFAPTNAENVSVLFHIHESNFVQGSADPALYGPEYLVSKGLILVLPNYRLGPLGFLCLRNTMAPGNAALKDLSMALQWIKNNIAKFGGNPDTIVVSGEGTSGALIGFLALSSSSRNYFDKAITESGSVLSYWALDRNPALTGEKLTEALTKIDNSLNLETADILTILRAAQNIHFRPCIEKGNNPFMTQTPWGMIREQEVNITFMIGSANYAGLNEALDQNEASIEQLNDDFATLLPDDLAFGSDIERQNVVRNVRSQYFIENKPITLEDHIEGLSLCFTDSCFLGPAIRTARSLANAGAKVYFYEFSFTELISESHTVDRPVEGAVRGDIRNYVFTQDGRILTEGTAEREVVDIMVDTWFTFIENGNPVANETDWNRLTVTVPAQEEWMQLGPEIGLKQGLHLSRLNLWTNIYNNYFIEMRNNVKRPNLNIYTGIVSLITYFGFRRFRIADYCVIYVLLSLVSGNQTNRVLDVIITMSQSEAPKPPPRWDGVFEATHRVKCPQLDIGDENCLVINIFTPEVSNNLPVLVHVHGGDYQNGWGFHQPPINLINKGIIIVTFNYRIGVLGFLCLGIPAAPGNVGLKDQVAALYWIQQNIKRFGGDPNDVTLYGTEAGSISIQLLLQARLMMGFHKVILESGSILSPTALTYNPIADAFAIGEQLGYNDTNNSHKLLKYLRKLSVTVLLDAHKISLPCVESVNNAESLIDKDPLQLLKDGPIDNIPMLVSYTRLKLRHNSEKLKTVPEDFVDLLPSNLEFTNDGIRYKISELIKDFYFFKDIDTSSSYENYLNDVLMVYPTVKYAVLYATKNYFNVYLMNFNYEADADVLSEQNKKLVDFIFGENDLNYNKNNEAIQKLTNLFSNFIKLGDPSPLITEAIPVIWQPVVGDEHRQIRTAVELVFKDTLKLKELSSKQELMFWDSIYDKFYKTHKALNEN